MKLTEFQLAYLEAALFAENDDDGEPLDENYSFSDIHPESLAKMIADCERFESENGDLLDHWEHPRWSRNEMSGHDFWFTRNHHGVGFWDGDWPLMWNGEWTIDLGEILTDKAQAFGECNLIVGDDGMLHVCG